MTKTILVCGHGPGISDAVARKFGAEGFKVALAARNAGRLTLAVVALGKTGVEAGAFPTDLADPAAVGALVAKVRDRLGPITALHWNAYDMSAGDLTKSTPAELRRAFDVSVTGLVAAVQAALPDLRSQKGSSAVLVTGGGFAFYDPQIDAMATKWNAMGTAISKAAQHKLAGVLAAKLEPEGIYVGEVVVVGTVKGTAFDTGQGTLEASAVANRFWQLYAERAPRSVQIP